MIDGKKIVKWAGGVGLGEAVGYLTGYAEQANPNLKALHFGELVELVGGPAAVGVAWKLSKNPRHEQIADFVGLAGVGLFIHRLGKLIAPAFGLSGVYSPGVQHVQYPMGMPQAPPPGFGGVQHSPITSLQRLPFQNDMTW